MAGAVMLGGGWAGRVTLSCLTSIFRPVVGWV